MSKAIKKTISKSLLKKVNTKILTKPVKGWSIARISENAEGAGLILAKYPYFLICHECYILHPAQIEAQDYIADIYDPGYKFAIKSGKTCSICGGEPPKDLMNRMKILNALEKL